MSAIFGGSRFMYPNEFSEYELPVKAADVISIGDLLWADGSNSNAARPLDLYVGSGVALTDRLTIKPIFAGVALEGRISGQTTTGYPAFPIPAIRITNDCFYEADVTSATYNEGDLVGVNNAATAAAAGDISPQTLLKVNNPNEAIGYVWKRYTTATTKVLCRIFGRLNDYINPALVPVIASPEPYYTYSASGAITNKVGVAVLTKSGVGAMTLAAPTAGTDDGKYLSITSDTANAHTVTCSAGVFKNGGAAVTVFTFTGTTSGGGVSLVAYNATWKVLGSAGGAFS